MQYLQLIFGPLSLTTKFKSQYFNSQCHYLAIPLLIHSDPLVTKLDFDKDFTPGRKHYPVHHDIREPLVQDKMPDKEEVQVQCAGNYKHCWYVVTDKQEMAAAELLMNLVCENGPRA